MEEEEKVQVRKEVDEEEKVQVRKEVEEEEKVQVRKEVEEEEEEKVQVREVDQKKVLCMTLPLVTAMKMKKVQAYGV